MGSPPVRPPARSARSPSSGRGEPTPPRLPAVGLQPGRQADIDECAQSPRPCAQGRCENTPGSYRCVCPAGYRPNPPGTSCADIDECAQIPRPCAQGLCENTAGSYRCTCPRGFRASPASTECLGKRGQAPAPWRARFCREPSCRSPGHEGPMAPDRDLSRGGGSTAWGVLGGSRPEAQQR
ncbi:hypothetical protein KIL84_001586 [Mauremys mutica]|uniref:EGF-like domain-containing protein n=1 Tax=Mauremys mutica TaxID=74926 RepID=A0A9D3XIN1_9SAUR|nr:hypothetical protein KIL84_001586 [Mauremys mutica]